MEFETGNESTSDHASAYPLRMIYWSWIPLGVVEPRPSCDGAAVFRVLYDAHQFGRHEHDHDACVFRSQNLGRNTPAHPDPDGDDDLFQETYFHDCHDNPDPFPGCVGRMT